MLDVLTAENQQLRSNGDLPDLWVKISYGIYPARSIETADCPVCGKEVLRKNITGDIETKVESLVDTKDQYKLQFKQRNES